MDVHPFSGPTHGGTLVTVVGHGLQLGNLACQFGGAAAVPARRQSSYRIACPAPAYPVTGWVTLGVLSYAGIAESGSAFFYQAPLSVEKGPTTSPQGETSATSSAGQSRSVIAPALGPVRGGTVVTLIGQNLGNVVSLFCRFGNGPFTVIARFVTARTLECMTPPHSEGQVSVDVSLNGQQFTSFGAVFTYYNVAVVTALDPSDGPVEGGTLMALHGKHFYRK